jgi:hypothetical protein
MKGECIARGTDTRKNDMETEFVKDLTIGMGVVFAGSLIYTFRWIFQEGHPFRSRDYARQPY